MKKIYVKVKFLLIPVILVFLGFFSFSQAGISDAFKAGSGGNLDKTASEMGYSSMDEVADPSKISPEAIIANIVQMVLSILGVLFIIYMVYGGVLWMTAGGNDQRIERAKNLIKRAIIGLVIVFLAYAISVFLVGIFINTATN